MTDAGSLYHGVVMHRRHGDLSHHFTYRVFSLLLDLDRIGELAARSRLFRHNRFGVLSFHDRDHGPGDGRPLRPWIERHLIAGGLGDLVGGRIRLLCFPRILGFVFNPLSVFFCDRPEGGLGAILYEVSNTFGDRHSYLAAVAPTDQPDEPAVVKSTCRKVFHVSPFIDLEGDYRFRVVPPGETLSIGIRQTAANGQALTAVLNGRRAAFTDGELARALVRYPLMTLKVVAAIHWEALKLWRKGAPFRSRPTPPAAEVSYPSTSLVATHAHSTPALSFREPLSLAEPGR